MANDLLSDASRRKLDDLRCTETSKRGCMVLTLTPGEARSDYVEVSTVFSRDYSARVATTLRVLPGASNLQLFAS